MYICWFKVIGCCFLMMGSVKYICMECKGLLFPTRPLTFVGQDLCGFISRPSLRSSLQPHQLSNQEWCHAALPGLSGGPPGDRPVPAQGLSGRFQHQSQRRDDSPPRCCADGPQHGHRLAGGSEGKPYFRFVQIGHRFPLMSLTSLISVLR